MLSRMQAIATRELKQNPAAALRRAASSGVPLEITTHGKSTGVYLVNAQLVSALSQARVPEHPLTAAANAALLEIGESGEDELAGFRALQNQAMFGDTEW